MGIPKVSVIVCTYNQEASLGRSLDSVLRQKVGFDYEIILADDCSADGTPEVCRRYAAEYPDKIRYIRNSRNKGVVRNYYDSIRASRGEYIADLAGDDEWCDDHKLARQIAIMDSDREIMLTHAGWRYQYPDGRKAECEWLHMPAAEEKRDGKELLPLLLNHEKEKYHIHLCTSVYRRDAVMELLEQQGELIADENLPCEDYQLEVLLAAKGKIYYEPAIVLNYSVGHKSVSSQEDHAKNVKFAGKVMELTHRLTTATGFSLSVNNGYFKRNMHYLAMNAFKSENPEAANFFLKIKEKRLWPADPGAASHIAGVLMRNRKLWKISVALWKSIRKG